MSHVCFPLSLTDYVVCYQPLPIPTDRPYDSGPRSSTASLRNSNLSSVEISLFQQLKQEKPLKAALTELISKALCSK